MTDYIEATLLSLEEKINFLDGNDRRLLEEITNHMLMTHELLQNHRGCGEAINQAPGYWPDRFGSEPRDYLGNHH